METLDGRTGAAYAPRGRGGGRGDGRAGVAGLSVSATDALPSGGQGKPEEVPIVCGWLLSASMVTFGGAGPASSRVRRAVRRRLHQEAGNPARAAGPRCRL